MNGTPPRIDAAERLAGLPSLEDSAGKALASTALIVDATMKAWAAYVVANNVPDAQQAKAKRAYEDYQAAIQAAQEAYAAITGTAGESVWNDAKAALLASSGALIGLISQGSAKAGMKSLLRDFITPKLSALAPYFSIRAVRAELKAARCPLEPATLNSYLHELAEAHFIYDAGRGWYSSLATPFTLNREPVSSLVQKLNQTFPLLEFSCWSTQQISSYGHHLLAKFVTFVHTERDTMLSVVEFLRDAGYDAHLNPRGVAAAQFAVRDRTVVVRPKVTTQPVEDHFVTIEGLLVELLFEHRSLHLMDTREYFQTFTNLTRQARISMARLLDYARQRELAINGLLESINAGFCDNPVLIDPQ